MFDTHCHLNNFFATESFGTTSSCEHNKDPSYYLAVCTQRQEWASLIAFAKSHNKVLPALGIHPWFVTTDYESDLYYLSELLSQNSINAIGEIGLDFLPQYSANKLLQVDCFIQQLELAQQYSLPLSLHCSKAHNEMLAQLKHASLTGVMHGFSSSVQMAHQYIDIGFKLGVNGVVCRSNARRYHELVKSVGLENIVLETDYPNINLPGLVKPHLADITTVSKSVADLLDVSVADVIEQTDYNAQQIFNRV